ncbi:hypothetical protein D0Y83_11210 [Qipengyuania flava]|uniref:Uncharacterized protein n=1 Tax=Qipengyuania flava TaxID=192812 RepID=A0A5P6NCM6_9SPHN|nr:hypothetical protein [Qipengyuania flava]QFI63769.1 hypothetical protein D0Y83_11210 [Qipengyuania flava]
MNAIANISHDDIRLFLPGIADEEHEKRAKMRSYRNAASAMIARTDSDNARSLAWLVVEYATGALYNPGAACALDDLNKLCKRLMLTAMQAEEIDLERFAE